MATRYKESAINTLVDSRRAEMLQQANALDERESFSPLRHFAGRTITTSRCAPRLTSRSFSYGGGVRSAG